jgi:hypothetical protein
VLTAGGVTPALRQLLVVRVLCPCCSYVWLVSVLPAAVIVRLFPGSSQSPLPGEALSAEDSGLEDAQELEMCVRPGNGTTGVRRFPSPVPSRLSETAGGSGDIAVADALMLHVYDQTVPVWGGSGQGCCYSRRGDQVLSGHTQLLTGLLT